MSEANIMFNESNSEHRVSLSCKIPLDWSQEIERNSELSGVTKSQWLCNLVGENLGKFNENLVSMIIDVLKNGDAETKRKALKKLLIFVAHSI